MGQPRRSTPSMMGWALARAGKSFGSIHPRHGDSVSSKLLDRGRDESRIFSISITGGPSWNDMMAGGWLDRRLFAVRGPMADSLDARCMHASCYMHARRPSCQQQQRASGPGVVSARTYCRPAVPSGHMHVWEKTGRRRPPPAGDQWRAQQLAGPFDGASKP